MDAAGPSRPDSRTRSRRPKDRALAYLAHGENADGKLAPFFGEAFGTVYDISTVVILWFAGASAMAGLLNLVPQYLPRYGMAPEWARAIRPLVLLFTVINLVVTWIFKASVERPGRRLRDRRAGAHHQRLRGHGHRRLAATRRAAGTAGCRGRSCSSRPCSSTRPCANVIEKPDGIKIASFFIAAILVTSFVSRCAASRELRFAGFQLPGPRVAAAVGHDPPPGAVGPGPAPARAGGAWPNKEATDPPGAPHPAAT